MRLIKSMHLTTSVYGIYKLCLKYYLVTLSSFSQDTLGYSKNVCNTEAPSYYTYTEWLSSSQPEEVGHDHV